MRQRILVANMLIAALFVLAACVSSPPERLSEAEKTHLAQQLIDRGDFLGLFENADKINDSSAGGGYFVTTSVQSYFDQHCENLQEVLNVLREAGFSVTGNIIDRSKSFKEQGYTEVYGAERRASKLPSFYSSRNYSVMLYLKQGRIDKVIATSAPLSL